MSYMGVGHVIFSLHLGVGHSVLLQLEGVGHVFSNHHISKCSAAPLPVLFDQSPLVVPTLPFHSPSPSSPCFHIFPSPV